MSGFWFCVYCGKQVNEGCPSPTMFSCCREVGHVEYEDTTPLEITGERYAGDNWLKAQGRIADQKIAERKGK